MHADASDSVLSEPGSEGALAKMQRWTAGALGGIKAPLRGSLARLGSIHMHKGRGATGAMWSSQSRHPPSPTAAAAAAQPQCASFTLLVLSLFSSSCAGWCYYQCWARDVSGHVRNVITRHYVTFLPQGHITGYYYLSWCSLENTVVARNLGPH